MRSVMQMKCLIVYAALIAVYGCTLTGVRPDHAGNAEPATDGPRIVFASRSHDFGTVPYSTAGLTHVFAFSNTGGSALLIKNVKAG